ncbi:hypothetical protein [Oryzibacter oryziterrae]|uniref:hypothetical protein n=1 Tax=Oryzibacter oryziterrae TaxID=2766474 RepID=UPI001F3BCDE7|nr:hypothetical protein [Oryzibacter oryziterrae]
MMLLDKSRENAESVRQIGQFARMIAQAAGTSIYYLDLARGGFIEELPGGVQRLVKVVSVMGAIVESADRRR